MNRYGIGGSEVPEDAREAVTDIPENRTLLIEKLTDGPSASPEIVESLHTIEEVFEYYKPDVTIEFKDKEGRFEKETLGFRNLGDFGAKGLSRQSEFLNDLTAECDEYHQIIKQVKSNKILRKVLSDPEQKEAFLQAIHALVEELEQTNI